MLPGYNLQVIIGWRNGLLPVKPLSDPMMTKFHGTIRPQSVESIAVWMLKESWPVSADDVSNIAIQGMD